MGIFECVILLVVLIAVLAIIEPDIDSDVVRRNELNDKLDDIIFNIQVNRYLEEAKPKRNRK